MEDITPLSSPSHIFSRKLLRQETSEMWSYSHRKLHAADIVHQIPMFKSV
uniref:Uncharacterized protein n=1 Tax=Arundo donax TaxID=35708 RepID=A0A0A9C072_ARUDO